MNNGYIKLDRKILDWKWFNDGNMLKMWIYLLESAQYRDTVINNITVERGQVLTDRKQLSKALKMSEQSVRTCLKNLAKDEISIRPTNKYSIITINKYDEYQSYVEPRVYRRGEDKLPTYSTKRNRRISEEEEDELLTLMGKKRYDPSNNPKIPEEKKREILERMGQLKNE